MAAPFGPPVLTPADFATLQNTLGPMGVLTQMEAERVTQAEQLAQRTRAAQEAAGQAGQAYQAAASQPPPVVAPNEELINSLFGGVASVLQQNPAAAQRAQQRTRDTRHSLLQARADNLQALRDGWKQKADFADKAGDLEESLKARAKYEQLSKTFDQLQQTQRLSAAQQEAEAGRKHDLAMEKLRHQNRLSEAKGEAVVGPQDILPYIDLHVGGDGQSTPIIRIADIPNVKERGAVYKAARQLGILAPNKTQSEALDLLGSVRSNISDIGDRIIPLLPEQGGATKFFGGMANQAQAATQLGEKGSALAGYPATRTAAIQTIQALASLGHGLRINQAEIKAAQNFDYPRIDDTQATAREKFRILSMMLQHIEDQVLGKPVPEAEIRAAVAAANAFKRGGKGRQVANTQTATSADPLGIR